MGIDGKKCVLNSYDVISAQVGKLMDACEYSAMITSLACIITKDKSKEELALISAMFNQLARSVDTIALYGICCASKEKELEKAAEEKADKEKEVKEIMDKNKLTRECEKILDLEDIE